MAPPGVPGRRTPYLYDMVINTLGAVAAGAGAGDPALVRERCRQDARTIDLLCRALVIEHFLDGWAALGARRALGLLALIADGEMDPFDAMVRTRCRDEEGYLRQILLLSPHLINLNEWFVPALEVARRRSITLDLRVGEIDARPAVADAFGYLVLDVIQAVKPHSQVTVGIFGTPVMSLTMVGPHDLASRRLWAADRGRGLSIKHRVLGAQSLFEISESY